MDSVNTRMRELRTDMVKNREGEESDRTPWLDVNSAPVTARRANTITRAPAYNRGIFDQFCAAGGGVLPSILRRVNVAPFTIEIMNNNQLDGHGLVLAHMICTLRIPRAALQKQQLILEVMAPELPLDQVMPENEARDAVMACLRNYGAMRDCAWIQDLMAAAVAQHAEVANADAAHWTCRLVRNAQNYGWARGTTLVQMFDYMHQLSLIADERQRGRALGVILMTVTSFSLRGVITHSKLSRVVNDLLPVIPYASEALNAADIALTWATFGHLVDDGNMPGIMRRWLGFVAAGAVRLRVLLAQAAGSGLTFLDVIARAINGHSDFSWPYVARMYPQEWPAAGRAITLVGGNPYYGYRHDLTEVRSTLFKNLAAFCGKLLVAAGDQSLDGYRGFVEEKINKESIMRMIDGYMSSQGYVDLASDIGPEEHAAFCDKRRLVAAHPANMEGLASMTGHPDPFDDDVSGPTPASQQPPGNNIPPARDVDDPEGAEDDSDGEGDGPDGPDQA